MTKPKEPIIKLAVRQAGGPAKLARRLGGLTSQAISQWTRCPAERVIAVAELSGVPRSELRPDIYPPKMEAAE
jgi:DNA-binding transcriptional regulator YdaS (Cro superfamily)